MTLEVFSRDIIPILQFIATFIGLIGIFLLWWQIRQTNIWNKLNSFKEFLDVSRTYELDKDLYEKLRAIEVDPNSYIREEDVQKILSNDSAHLAVKAFLNDTENLCSAIRIGAIDYEGAYAVHSARVIAIYERYKKFIDSVRKNHDDDEIYIELEKIALEWSKKHLRKVDKERQKVEELKRELNDEKGVKPKV